MCRGAFPPRLGRQPTHKTPDETTNLVVANDSNSETFLISSGFTPAPDWFTFCLEEKRMRPPFMEIHTTSETDRQMGHKHTGRERGGGGVTTPRQRGKAVILIRYCSTYTERDRSPAERNRSNCPVELPCPTTRNTAPGSEINRDGSCQQNEPETNMNERPGKQDYHQLPSYRHIREKRQRRPSPKRPSRHAALN